MVIADKSSRIGRVQLRIRCARYRCQRQTGHDLDLGLKEQALMIVPHIRQDRQKPILFSAILAKRKVFLIIHELSVPAQQSSTAPLCSFRTQPQQIPL